MYEYLCVCVCVCVCVCTCVCVYVCVWERGTYTHDTHKHNTSQLLGSNRSSLSAHTLFPVTKDCFYDDLQPHCQLVNRVGLV